MPALPVSGKRRKVKFLSDDLVTRGSFFRTLVGIPGAASFCVGARRPCWVGVNASSVSDICSMVNVLPPYGGDDRWVVQPFFWIPRGRIGQLERQCRVPFSLWVERGFIEVASGDVVNLGLIVERIKSSSREFDLREVAYDRWSFRHQALDLMKARISCVEVPQTYLQLSAATKFLIDAYQNGVVADGGSPVMNWMAGCCELREDSNGNCRFVIPDRRKAGYRIDGFTAVVNAVSRILSV